MSEKVIQRRKKNSLKINHEDKLVSTRKKQQRLLKPIYFMGGLGVLVGLYQILIGFMYVEYTNIPINLPKLVNETISERFWGTYR
jgi:uncharacterized membrane protein